MEIDLLRVVFTIIVVGVLLWLANTYIPMDGTVKKILNAVVIIGLVLWLMYTFGLLGPVVIRVPVRR